MNLAQRNSTMRQIGMAAHVGAGKTTAIANKVLEHKIEIGMSADNSFEINGVRYIERPSKESRGQKSRFHTIMMASMVLTNMYDMGGNSYQRQLPKGIDLVEEFRLIGQKKSKLSKWERDVVCYQFESKFIKVESNTNTNEFR